MKTNPGRNGTMAKERLYRLLAIGMRFAGKWSHAVISACIIFALAYILGYTMLNGPLRGNDAPMHLSYAEWLNGYFPDIPHWYPLHGGGVSLLHGYPITPHLSMIMVHRITGLSIAQAIRLIGFLSIPLTATGIYLFCWSAYDKQNMGLIAGIFYVLAPVTWTWGFDWGFFAQQVGMIFLPLILIAFDKSVRHNRDSRRGGRGRLWFVALVLLVFMAVLCHMIVAAAAAVMLALYIGFASLVAGRGERRKTLLGGLKVYGLLGLTVGIMSAGYLAPFYAYSSAANREGLNTPPIQQLHRLPISEFFGLSEIVPAEVMTRMQFPLVVVILAAVGMGLALLRGLRGDEKDRKVLAIGLSGLVATIYTLSPSMAAVILRISPVLLNFLSFRSLLLADMLLMPLTAAFGVWALAEILIYPDKLIALLRGRTKQVSEHRLSPRPVLVSLISLLLAMIGILNIGMHPQGNSSALPYGPLTAGIDLEDIWLRGDAQPDQPVGAQLLPASWPEFVISDEDETLEESAHIAAQLPLGRHLRVDVSPYNGRLAMDLVSFADASQINTYTYQINLIHAMWGYQQNVFYSRETEANESGTALALNGLAQWFGTEYVSINTLMDPYETYEAAGWEMTYEEGDIQWWRNPDAPALASATSRPAILLLGKQETDAYMTVFRLANDGMLPYDEVLLVEGQPRIDKYTLEDLQPFDGLILYGYDYRNSGRAWDTIADYVRQGGSVYVDTGWEYWIPEWEFDQAPDVLPLERLTWTDYGLVETLSLDHPEIAGDIDVSQFRPLAWDGNPWALSGAYADDVRPWGRIVLSAAGRPLVVAGEYGEGRIVWSGMNLIGHARYGELNREEVRFVRNLLMWMIDDQEAVELQDPVVERYHPDQVRFGFSTAPDDITWLYWREAYYPNWHAFLQQDSERVEIPIYRAGPGFMLMPIEGASNSATVTLQWQPSMIERAASLISLFGLALVGAFFMDGLFLNGMLFSWMKSRVFERLPRPFLGEGSNVEWAEEKRREIEAMKNGFDPRSELPQGRPKG